MKEINLEDFMERCKLVQPFSTPSAVELYDESNIKVAMFEFGKQLLELAAENAYCNHEFDSAHGCEYSVNKESILNTINQITYS